jgi:hypothetical protein
MRGVAMQSLLYPFDDLSIARNRLAETDSTVKAYTLGVFIGSLLPASFIEDG